MDELERLIEAYSPKIIEDQFARLCYEIFINNEDGRLLMQHLFNNHVHAPFTNILDKDASIDMNKILAKAVRRDFIQSLLLQAQSYQQVLQKSGEM